MVEPAFVVFKKRDIICLIALLSEWLFPRTITLTGIGFLTVIWCPFLKTNV